MNPHLKEMFSDNGVLSFMRGAAGVVVLTGCYSVLHQLWFFDTVDFFGSVGVIATGLGAKAAQKHIEIKKENGKAD
jgi:hypothetical protein